MGRKLHSNSNSNHTNRHYSHHSSHHSSHQTGRRTGVNANNLDDVDRGTAESLLQHTEERLTRRAATAGTVGLGDLGPLPAPGTVDINGDYHPEALRKLEKLGYQTEEILRDLQDEKSHLAKLYARFVRAAG